MICPEENEFTILAVGRLHPVKNHVFLIRACAQLKQKGFPFLCIIIGEGETRKELNRLVAKLGLVRDVKIIGFIEKPFFHVFYKMANLFVLTSSSEGLPLTLMEAMANEKVVLAPNITSIPEVIKDGENGFLYESGNIDDFVKKILFISEKGKSSDLIGRQARNQIRVNYDRRKNMELFADTLISRLESKIHRDEEKGRLLNASERFCNYT